MSLDQEAGISGASTKSWGREHLHPLYVNSTRMAKPPTFDALLKVENEVPIIRKLQEISFRTGRLIWQQRELTHKAVTHIVML
jgi:hypothetical protein